MLKVQRLLSFVIVPALAFTGLLSLVQDEAHAQLDNNCIITINKVSVPDTDTEFNFLVTGVQETIFSLSDPSNPSQLLGINVQQSLTVTEDVVPGWRLESIECVEGVTNCGMDGFEPCLSATVDGNSVTFECLDNDTASCTFTNVQSVSNIPTLSEWGLIAMAAVIGGAGIFMTLRRRKAAA